MDRWSSLLPAGDFDHGFDLLDYTLISSDSFCLPPSVNSGSASLRQNPRKGLIGELPGNVYTGIRNKSTGRLARRQQEFGRSH
jgi:hypothetical protein